ncbi:MAG: hypothetical protein GWN87_05630 [Desulfuromonadales bacterium]|nr:hypothetical protein [Desulfuromonadales bacterium]
MTIEKAEEALGKFQEPDPYSRSEDFQGRRIAKDGRDWIILNYAEHRRRQQAEAEKARKRDWWRKNRAKPPKLDEKLDATSETSGPLAPTSETRRKADPDTEADPDKRKKERKKKESDAALPVGFALFWEEWPKKVAKLDAIKAWRNKLKGGRLPHVTRIIQSVKAQKHGRQWREGVICNPATWINGERWNDEVEPVTSSSSPSPGPESAADRQYRENRDLLTRLAKEQKTNGPNHSSNDASQ